MRVSCVVHAFGGGIIYECVFASEIWAYLTSRSLIPARSETWNLAQPASPTAVMSPNVSVTLQAGSQGGLEKTRPLNKFWAQASWCQDETATASKRSLSLPVVVSPRRARNMEPRLGRSRTAVRGSAAACHRLPGPNWLPPRQRVGVAAVADGCRHRAAQHMLQILLIKQIGLASPRVPAL